ncbi:MAG: hypothetical protein WAL34_04315 [Acidobacteriaceae bacterium]
MSEQLTVGDKVVYEDAYTGETKFGEITNMAGGDAVIRTITQTEAGPSPKRLPKLQVACVFARDSNDVPVCSFHRQPLAQLTAHSFEPNPPGLGHFTAWVCPVSSKTIYDAGF